MESVADKMDIIGSKEVYRNLSVPSLVMKAIERGEGKLSSAGAFVVNTGWSGGPYGTGRRMKLKYTRAMVSAALNGQLGKVKYKRGPVFNIFVPEECPDVPKEILSPRDTWTDKDAYDRTAKDIASQFERIFRNTAICLKRLSRKDQTCNTALLFV